MPNCEQCANRIFCPKSKLGMLEEMEYEKEAIEMCNRGEISKEQFESVLQCLRDKVNENELVRAARVRQAYIQRG